jgi:hypothetical protein
VPAWEGQGNIYPEQSASMLRDVPVQLSWYGYLTCAYVLCPFLLVFVVGELAC